MTARHYLPPLVEKPAALLDGAPLKDCDLPAALIPLCAKLKPHADRQCYKIFGAVRIASEPTMDQG